MDGEGSEEGGIEREGEGEVVREMEMDECVLSYGTREREARVWGRRCIDRDEGV